MSLVKVKSRLARLITLTRGYEMYQLWPGQETMVPSDVLEAHKQWLDNGDLVVTSPAPQAPEPKPTSVPVPSVPVATLPVAEAPKPEKAPAPLAPTVPPAPAPRAERPNRFLKQKKVGP